MQPFAALSLLHSRPDADQQRDAPAVEQALDRQGGLDPLLAS